MSMKILPLDQGSDAWLEARLNHFTASEAAAMMNESPYMSRDELLDLKKGWKNNPIDKFKEKLFADGHRFEAMARPIAEMEIMDDLPAIVGSIVIEGVLMLASFDGYNVIVWEHKGWNESLAENTRNGVMNPVHYWQAEQQLAVSGAEYVLFNVSDGTKDKRVSMKYYPVEGRREQLIKGWEQFDIDLNGHELEAKQEFIPAIKDTSKLFPVIEYEVQEGALVVSNAKQALAEITQLAHAEMQRKLECDQDFSEKHNVVKATIVARQELKQLHKRVEGEFVSYSQFSEYLQQIDKVLQKMQSDGEGKLKTEKDKKKAVIIAAAEKKLKAYVKTVAKKIVPVLLSSVQGLEWPDFDKACKNKRTLASIKSNVNAEFARVRIEIDTAVEHIKANQKLIIEAQIDYPVLFNDAPTLALKDTEALEAIIKIRIHEHIEAEEVRLKKINDDRIALEEAEAEKKKQEADDKFADDLRANQEAEDKRQAEKQKEADALAQQEALMATDASAGDDLQVFDPAEAGSDKTVTATIVDGEITSIKEEPKHESVHMQGRMVRKNSYSGETFAQPEPEPAPVPVDLNDRYVRGHVDGLSAYAWKDFNDQLRVGTTVDSILLTDAINKFWIQFQEDQKERSYG